MKKTLTDMIGNILDTIKNEVSGSAAYEAAELISDFDVTDKYALLGLIEDEENTAQNFYSAILRVAEGEVSCFPLLTTSEEELGSFLSEALAASSFSYGEGFADRECNYWSMKSSAYDAKSVTEKCITNGIVTITRFGYLVDYDKIAEADSFAYAI